MNSPTSKVSENRVRWAYSIYNIAIQSDVYLPNVPEADDSGKADVYVTLGTVSDTAFPAVDTGVFWKTAPNLFSINVEGVARYLVRDGREVVVQPEDNAQPQDLAAFLLGSVMGALIYQRGLLPLHASAVLTNHGAVLFAGHSGAGKSTLLAGMQQRGYAVLADDISAVSFDPDGRPVMAPAFPWMKVCEDAAIHIGVESTGLARDPSGRKFITPVHSFADGLSPIHHIFVLGITSESTSSVRDVAGTDAVAMLSQATYRRKFMKGLGVRAAGFSALTRLASQVPVTNLLRPDNLESLSTTLDRIEQRCG